MQRTNTPDTPAEFSVLWLDGQKQSPEVFHENVFLKILNFPLETPVLESLL